MSWRIQEIENYVENNDQVKRVKKLLSSLEAVSSCQLPQSQNQRSPPKFGFSNNANNF